MRVAAGLALVATVVALATGRSQDKKDETAAADLKALVGKWKVEKAELGGQDARLLLQELKFEITAGGKYVAELAGQKDEGTFTVDPSKSPKTMDITGTTGPNKGKTIPAIYQLEGDTLTIAYELDGGQRPTKFESPANSKVFLAVYKREKK
jgi:uncharacterized protein (TIGR03067 family)